MGKATLVSMMPLVVDENQAGSYPGRVNIAAAAVDDIEIFLVPEDTRSFFYIGEERSIPNITPAFEFAEAVVKDFIKSLEGVSETKRPAFFALEGEWTKERIKKELGPKLQSEKSKQNAWFSYLVSMGDAAWIRSRNNPRAITDMMREAATRLGLVRDWNLTMDPDRVCPFCRTALRSGAVVCMNCRHVVDVEAYNKMSPVKVG